MSEEPLLKFALAKKHAKNLVEKSKTRNFTDKIRISDVGNMKSDLEINYYTEEKLTPFRVLVSSRYIVISYEPDNGQQQVDILLRHTHQLIERITLNEVINVLYLYDPLDIDGEHDCKFSEAHVLMMLTKSGEGSRANFKMLKIQNNGKITTINHTHSNYHYDISLTGCSPDMRYIAIGELTQCTSEQ